MHPLRHIRRILITGYQHRDNQYKQLMNKYEEHTGLIGNISKWEDQVFKIDKTNYKESSIILSSDDYAQFYEAVLVTEKHLTSNSCWDIRRVDNSVDNNYVCEIHFKWNGYVTIMDRITRYLKLPSGVKKEFRFFKNVTNS